MRTQAEKLTIVLLVLVALGAVSCNREQPDPTATTSLNDSAGATDKIAEADRDYSQREDLSKVRAAIVALRQAQTLDYGNYDVAWRLARANFFLGDHTTDEKEREDAFRAGIEAGKLAAQLQPDKPDGHFWLGANYGGDAEHSTLAGLANVEDIRTQMERVIQIDESYQNGSAYLGLGELYLRAPRVLGGDTQKAIDYLEKGLRFGSDNALLRVTLAEAYHEAKRDADAKKQIEYIMQMKSSPEYMAEYNDSVARAKNLSEEIARQ